MHPNVIDDPQAITDLLAKTKRIAVLGIKTEQAAGQPAFTVPEYLAGVGYDVEPVPVYYPDATEILGRKVYRSLVEVSRAVGPIDMVDVFRRPQDLDAHLDDILAAKPKSVWLQLGIQKDSFAETLAEAGITVVQNRCLLVEVQMRRRGL
ncbi:CoA-binding protein [Labilithrix luteola]|uniref:CoA-binding protein n=1 Tax=Labilithrix luteola TaxID=1391654 RepID=UPI001F0B25DD|nr:CoA-binding protein [Labilithrix luteola]